MPEIARFDGVFIRFDDHRLPHFHATYAEHDVSIAIAISTLEVLQGGLPRTQMHKVRSWARSHHTELWTIWRETRPG